MSEPVIETREQLDELRALFQSRWKASFEALETDCQRLRELNAELVGALTQLLAEDVSLRRLGASPDSGFGVASKGVGRARAAIAKATGETE